MNRKLTKLVAMVAACAGLALLVGVSTVAAEDTPASPDAGGGTGNGIAPGAPNPVPATWDHLKCYKIKDAKPFPPGPTVSLIPHGAFDSEDCSMKKLKADELCVDVEKSPDPTKLGPIPPIGAYPPNAWDYLCYKVKCVPDQPAKGFAVFVSDQFGARIITLKKPKRLCVPLTDIVVLGPP